MKTFGTAVRWLAMGGLLAASSALAQKEQWLEYHTTREGRGYRSLDLTTNPPANVALPKFNAQPYFARWSTPMDPNGGRWLCFDRTRKSGPYDRVYFDTKGDGRLDDKTPASARQVDEYNATFDSVRVVFKGEDGPITYHLGFRFMKYEGSPVQAYASSCGYYSGLVDFGGKKRRVDLLDNNVNGAFNDKGAEPGDCDCVLVENDKAGDRYLGKLLEADNQFFRLEVARDGAFLKLQKAEGLTFGQTTVPETISQLVLFGENGHFVRKPEKGQFSLPAGSYRVLEWAINRKDEKGAAWSLTGDGGSRFDVAADKAATLAVGEPVRAELQASQTSNPISFSLRFRGRSGETVTIRKGEQNPPGPKLILASLNGTYKTTNTFEFG